MMADGAGTSSFCLLDADGEEPMMSSPEAASCFKYRGMTCSDVDVNAGVIPMIRFNS